MKLGKTLAKIVFICSFVSAMSFAVPALAEVDTDFSDGVRGDPAVLEEIRDRLDLWLTAFNAKDADALFDLYHDDHIYAPAESSIMYGVPTVRAWYTEAFPFFKGNLLFKEKGMFHDGRMVLQLGEYYLQPNAESPADMPVITGGVALVWYKNAEGEWKLIYDTDNNPPGIEPSTFDGK
ncbi:nuclear transport factor 2 family protein [Alteromonas sp. 5E99-2]|uniref:YybH family protein n=1 Tax=Alteromonas sp. 5E99-2 TaxID=2817683 RepID=UPI001A99A23E|nr:nuclear transport factor 2 family protein [Alteromonas sp. 5E99-2]MBO1254679.1 nuclear transport factor 2 family protein [Alteromonas sp. 5E99-2]